MKIFNVEVKIPGFMDAVTLFVLFLMIWLTETWLVSKHLLSPHGAWIAFSAAATGAVLSAIGIQARKSPLVFLLLAFSIYLVASSFPVFGF